MKRNVYRLFFELAKYAASSRQGHLVTKIFFDALFFALAIPFFEVLERLQDNGLVPILLRMP